MSEQRISLHPTAVSQPCTNCGVHGHWSHAGRQGTFTPPPGHTLREDGTIACPNPSGWLHSDAVPKSEALTIAPLTADEQQRELVCAYLRHHGINPDHVPADADADINLDRRTLSVEVLVPRASVSPFASENTIERTHDRVRRTVPLLVTFDDFRRNLATPS